MAHPHIGLPPLWPCLKRIGSYLKAENKAVEWFKTLQQNQITTLEAAAGVSAEECLHLKIPLRVLIEVRALYMAFLDSQSMCIDRVSELQQSGKPRTASVEDISPYLNLTSSSDDISIDKSKKKGGTIRLKSNKPMQRARKTLSMSMNFETQSTISGTVNLIGQVGHPDILLRQAVKSDIPLNPKRPVSMNLEVYGKQIELEIRNNLQAATGCNLAVIVFARNSIRSFTKMMDRYFKSICKNDGALQTPILLVGIIVESLVGKNKFVMRESVLEAAELMKALRYIEVTTAANAKEVFLEIGRIFAREHYNDINFQRLSDFNGKIQRLNEKKPELTFKRKALITLPNSFLQCVTVIQKLRLDNNSIRYFPVEVFLCSQLRELSLNDNQIEEIPSSIHKLTLLTRFEIERNRLDSLPLRSLRMMQNIQEFKVAGNPLSKVPSELIGKGKTVKLESILAFKGEIVDESAEQADITVAEKDREPFPIFGVPLQELMENEYELLPDNPIPRVARITTQEILRRGLCAEGIFRMAGQANQCTELRDKIDSTTDLNFLITEENVHNLTAILKQWVRGLPEPVILYDNFDKIIKLSSCPLNEQIEGFLQIMETLPRENFHLVRLLFRVMYIVGRNAEMNRMDFSNVAKVIGPNIAYSRSKDQENPMETLNNVNFVNDLFSNVAAHFPLVFERDDVNLFEIDYLQDNYEEDDESSCVLYRKLSGHSKSIISAVLSSTGKYMWSGDSKGAFRIWNTQTTELVSSYDTSANRINCMTRVGQKILLGTPERLQIRNEETGDLIHEIQTATFNVGATDTHFWIGNDVESIDVYDIETFEKETIKLEGFVVLYLTKVNHSMWGACTDRKIRVWDVETRECVQEIEVDQGRLNSLTVIGSNVWGAMDNACIVVWDFETYEIRTCLDSHHSGKVFGATQVGNNAWTFAWDGQIHVYNTETFEHVKELPRYHFDAIGAIVCVRDETYARYRVFTISWDKTITVWLANAQNNSVSKGQIKS